MRVMPASNPMQRYADNRANRRNMATGAELRATFSQVREVENWVERSHRALAMMTRSDPPPWLDVARLFLRPPNTWPVGPVSARGREVLWLLRRYGPPMPLGPFQTVRPRSLLSFRLAHAVASLAEFCGASESQSARLARVTIDSIDGPERP